MSKAFEPSAVPQENPFKEDSGVRKKPLRAVALFEENKKSGMVEESREQFSAKSMEEMRRQFEVLDARKSELDARKDEIEELYHQLETGEYKNTVNIKVALDQDFNEWIGDWREFPLQDWEHLKRAVQPLESQDLASKKLVKMRDKLKKAEAKAEWTGTPYDLAEVEKIKANIEKMGG